MTPNHGKNPPGGDEDVETLDEKLEKHVERVRSALAVETGSE